MLRFALFDLDNTLYPANSGLWEAIAGRINLYMIERLGIDPSEVVARRRNYLAAFGTTLKGLSTEFAVDPLDFLEFVHDLPLDRYLDRDAELDAMLERLPLRKIIFTNADAPHARRVLARLGIERHFERIIDIHSLEFVNKPDERAYQRALSLLGARADECVFVEDTLINLLPARALGMRTVLVTDAREDGDVDYRIGRPADLEAALGLRSGN
jgi:putative hydrolase of the HAD superfamily